MPPVGDRITYEHSRVSMETIRYELGTASRMIKEFFNSRSKTGAQTEKAVYLGVWRGSPASVEAWLELTKVEAGEKDDIPQGGTETTLVTRSEWGYDPIRHFSALNLRTYSGEFGFTGMRYEHGMPETEVLRIDAIKNINETLDLILQAQEEVKGLSKSDADKIRLAKRRTLYIEAFAATEKDPKRRAFRAESAAESFDRRIGALGQAAVRK